MRRSLFLLIAALCSLPALSQIYCGANSGFISTCSSSTCYQNYLKPDLGDSVYWQGYQINCCGSRVTVWINTGDSCGGAAIAGVKRKSMELLLSQGVRLIANDCAGRPTIYTGPKSLLAEDEAPPLQLYLRDKDLIRDLKGGSR